MTVDTMERKTLDFGKVDYNGSGRKNCRVTVEVELREQNGNLELSICGSVWNPGETDIYSGGQNLDQLVELVPTAKMRRIHEVWQRWHLNAMKAGTPAQEAFLRLRKADFPGYPTSYYDWAKDVLRSHGLQPDNGYSYGSAWLTEELPADIIAEVRSW